MAVSDEVFILGLEIVIYLTLAMSWNFSLFKAKEGETNVIKVLFIWLLLWLMPLMTQYALLDLTADKETLMLTLYQVNMWVAWIVSIIMAIFFLMNVGVYMSRIGGQK